MSAEADTLEHRVRDALALVIDPEIRRPITELDMVGEVSADDHGAVAATIRLTIVGCPAASTIEREVTTAIESVDGVTSTIVTITVMTRDQRAALTDKLRDGRARSDQFGPASLTRIIAISSGKGGVGKSTITANLAVSLAARGLSVGLMDADVFGFSIPGLLGIEGMTPTRIDGMILPPVAHGVKVISIGMFLPPRTEGGGATAVSWRGPMLHRTIQQFITDVYFGDLDVLLIDLPPGTGDVAISLGQLLPQAEVIVVTTPQPAAAEVAERSGTVARQTGQRVIGVVENMSGYVQSDGSVLELFGSGGGADLAARLSEGQEAPVRMLASVPLSVALREGGDRGVPVVLADPADAASVAIMEMADEIASQGRDLAGRRLGFSVR